MAKVYRHDGKMRLYGVPFRDIPEAEYQRLGPLQRRWVDTAGGWELVTVADDEVRDPGAPTVPNFPDMTKAQILEFAATEGLNVGDAPGDLTKAELVDAATRAYLASGGR